jgi:succinyl-diaminopimelate desuccinylase
MTHIMEKYFNEVVDSICKIVRFDSSLKPADGEYPFGKETADCLDFFLSLAKDMGFETHNYDNYVGEVIFGEGEELAILAHLDVVPAGDGWRFPPFAAAINDEVSKGGVTGEKIWGRGTMDDKGPAVAVLYCLKALKDEGFQPKRKIKLIVGCNEECGWACIDHYKKVAHMPDEGFTPDADFPAIYAEKGILHFASHFPLLQPPFTSFKAGTAVNMVADKAEAILTDEAAEKLSSYTNDIQDTAFSYDKKSKTLTVTGRAAHGSTPEKGANALQAMLKFFATMHAACKTAYDLLFADSLSLKKMHDITGHLTMSPDVASYENGVLTITTDIRFPSTHKKEEITTALESAGVKYEIKNYQAPLYNDPNGKLISTLMQVYNQATGKNEAPIAIGGGTYARALKCGCGFGPELEDEEATIHQPNEYITFSRVRMMCEIYYDAIKQLTK